MDSLREFTILESFKQLNGERQKVLLEEMLKITGQTNIEVKFEHEYQQKLYNFCKMKWKFMSLRFFERFLERWHFLMCYSEGNNVISSCEVGDMYLCANSLGEDYDHWPFESLFEKYQFFYNEVPKKCIWNYMYISVLKENHEWCTNYLISDLMELDDEKFKEKVQEFGYPAELL